MSRINMKVGITAEQVNEANDAMNAYHAALESQVDGQVDTNLIDRAIALMDQAVDMLNATLGGEHAAARRVSDASIRAQEALDKVIKSRDKDDARITKLFNKVRMYDGWFVMVDGNKIPVTDVRTVDGLVVYGGENHPFIPVYFPVADADKGLRSLFDQD